MATCPSCGTDNPDGFRFCGACGTRLLFTSAQERKVVTALFCDLVDSTVLGETHDLEELQPVFRSYFDEVSAAVERHGGQVEKFIGYGVAVVFGLPIAHEDDALRAVRAALEIQRAVGALAARSGIPLRCRIGVNTGEVLVTVDEAPLLGDTMNTAARLGSKGSPGGILIGESTYRLVRDAVLVDAVEPVRAKGKTTPVVAFLLRDVMEGAPGFRRHLDSPLVGRVRELSLLLDARERALADRSVHLFTLIGDPGVGKTRLVEEFMQTAAPDSSVARGRCLAYGEGITFWPVAEIVRGAAGVLGSDSVDETRAKVSKLLPESDDRATIVERVTELLGMDATPNAEQTFWAVRKTLEAMAAGRPLVCVIEDLHWAEPGLLDLIDHVTDWSHDASILLLCTARPEFLGHRSDWGGGKLNATTLALQPLSAAEVDELIANLLGGSNLASTVIEEISRAAEGNPLFIEQFLAMLSDAGLRRPEGGRWVSTQEQTDVSVPPSIRALLGARLDALDEPERRLLEAAAVEGRTFHVGTVASLCDLPRAQVADLLLGMVRNELLRGGRPQLEGEEAFRFRHILIADVAYETIPKRRRAELHERFADELEARLGDRVPEYHEILGYHLERSYLLTQDLGVADGSSVAAQAAEHLSAAGRRALARGDTAAAAALLDRARRLLPAGPDRLAILPDLALALGERARWADARRLLDDALASTSEEEAGTLWHRLRVERCLARTAGSPGVAEGSLSVADDARAAAELAGDDLLLARALVCRARGLEYLWPPDLVGAKGALELACEAAEQSGDVRVLADARNYLGGVYCWGPFSIEDAVELCRRVFFGGPDDDPLLRAYADANAFARAEAFRGEFDAARASLDRAIRSFSELGSIAGWVGASSIRVEVELLAGDPAAAAEALAVAEGLVERMDPEAIAAYAADDLALYHALIGEVDEADRWLSRAEERADPESDLWRSGVRARILLARGDTDEAVTLARRSVPQALLNGGLDHRAVVLRSAADVFEAAGSKEELRATLTALVEAEREEGNLVATRQTEERLAALGS
jgi:class 3 adenylate cyclase/tetratricopeptide (TPR) repeat protein